MQAIPTADGWLLRGRKAWCSLAGELTNALVTATTLTGERRMFAVDLTAADVTAEPAHWVARGLDIDPGRLAGRMADLLWYGLRRPIPPVG